MPNALIGVTFVLKIIVPVSIIMTCFTFATMVRVSGPIKKKQNGILLA